jgi:hypothetical protein
VTEPGVASPPAPGSQSTLGDDTLVFLHLPKTGGTSLRSALRVAYRADEAAFIYGARDLDEAMTQERFEALPDERLRSLRLVMGHVKFGLHVRIGRPCRYVALIRDPVERVVSLYYHYRNLPGIRFAGPGHRERLRLRWKRISLEDWVFREARIAADNLMVRNIAGSATAPFGQCSEALYEQALRNVDQHFAALLVCEDMARSVSVLSRIIERDLPAVGRENANPRRPALEGIEPAVIARIRDLNRFDLRLHELARDRLARAAG